MVGKNYDYRGAIDLYSNLEYNMKMKHVVDLSLVKKALRKTPRYIADKVLIWADMVEKEGLLKVQKVPGFRDHALKGDRKGQRSVYLNKQWRLIYTLNKSKEINIVRVEEVMPHDY